MSKDKCVQFKQSVNDFPCSVELGKNNPTWGITRWGGDNGLRFVPFDDEGFSVRGDKRRLLYKGRRRSHRFTIHGDTAFEYDCILEREPESNVISLLIEGAEHYDFFRQPDFVPDQFLKGSLAVYKKEAMLGEGTGKLCHIHRPQIIDARGRRCWGNLAAAGNELRITIPDWFLSEAKYPVVVDPIIGTTTVGSQNKHVFEPGQPAEPLTFELSIPVNRFIIPETINGMCTAYVYANQDDYEAGGRPVLYSNAYDEPHTRNSVQEKLLDLRVTSGKPAGWRSAAFISDGALLAGNYIWFGVCCEYYWLPRFDYGVKCYAHVYDNGIPGLYPYKIVDKTGDFKLSMYFTYTKDFVRAITQGVKLSDNRVIAGNYIRNAQQTVRVNSTLIKIHNSIRKALDNIRVNSALSRFETFYRNCVMTAHNKMSINRLQTLIRKTAENIKVTVSKKETRSLLRNCADNAKVNSGITKIYSGIRETKDSLRVNSALSRFGAFYRTFAMTAHNYMNISRLPVFFRIIANSIKATAGVLVSRSLLRVCADNVKIGSEAKRFLSVLRNIKDGLISLDKNSFSVLFARSIKANAIVADTSRHIGAFIRGLLATAGSKAGTSHKAEYYRFQTDTVQAQGTVFRFLSIFIRIAAQIFIRDYLLRRFLKARQELAVKSCVSREIFIESKIE